VQLRADQALIMTSLEYQEREKFQRMFLRFKRELVEDESKKRKSCTD